ncbi:hypothetical protein Fleli_0884 [Bernardetia litoralis DSM 6794]|uniref:Uncharacterized protein n=1 Tax=Bernardetia litoralis (strain ATCC 23117 / DSM 6794 / NBRC 15988 / NCIMB 1366 / Fx l1 / Sio-4) TaxID=880071 RepID=I4AHA5_BERLS|nr:hypothetical protein [Bernardetia litoralis]AFM03340.1 hypothetical protein Fleli_0884 [Bernardetia litoralis DSM 6794]
MKTTFFTTLLFIFFSFCSFASESDSKPSTQQRITTNHISKKSKFITIKKQKKLNFKERLALKLVKRKIKKAQKKQAKNIKSEGDGILSTILTSVFLILVGLIGGIIALAFGETLLGVLLLVGGLIFVPLILLILLVGFFAGDKTRNY